MKRNYGINVVYFANISNLVRSFFSSWDFKQISNLLKLSGFKILLLPFRGTHKLNPNLIPVSQVISYEAAWNYSKFFPALFQQFKQKETSGKNYGKQGTLLDWLFFGDKFQSYTALKNIERFYPSAIKSIRGLLSGPIHQAREINPETEWEYKNIKHQLKLGKTVFCYPGLENELRLILESKDFLSYLYKSNLRYCVDIFHTFQRGSRDGRNPNPVVPKCLWFEFLVMMAPKVIEVRFSLDKLEVSKIISGRAMELNVFEVMSYVYHNYDCDIIYNLNPDLFSSVESNVKKLESLHVDLVTAFLLFNYNQI